VGEAADRPAPVILGTAGHIDHGKTSLVRALTGIDTDRLPEEKARGITIELGFAHLTVGKYRFGIVDVPGHERFVKAMVAGAVGVDLVVLVVAADEGVMPQTREHLDICQLLGVQAGLVALTKRDAVDDAFAELVIEDLRSFLKGTFLEKAPIIPCSATTGAGIDALKDALVALAPKVRTKDPDGLLRLPLDRVFTMHGFGTVVTGTLAAGRLRVGDEIAAEPSGVRAKVRGLEVHGEGVEEARAGQRTAVNLLGTPKEAVARGQVLVHPGELRPTSIADVRLEYLAVCRVPLKRRSKVLLHAGTAMVEGTALLVDRDELEPGGTALAQLHLAQPLVLLPGDRFILRGFAAQEGYGTTVGGGEVLRVLGPKLRKSGDEAAAILKELEGAPAERRVAAEVRLAGFGGLDRAQLGERLSFSRREIDAALSRLLSLRELLRFDKERGSVVHEKVLASLRTRTLELVDRSHAEAPERPGLSREELRSRLPADLPVRLFTLVVDGLVESGELVAEKDLVRRKGHTVERAASAVPAVAERMHSLLVARGLSPPRLQDLPTELGEDWARVAAAVDFLAQRGQLVRVGRELVFAEAPVAALRGRLVAHLKAHTQIDAQTWKEMCGTTRKFAIPLAEHFDAEKVTIRVGEVRRLRGAP
jgi:selenocysteine-specific elongation factor